ncbi:putative cytoplasmic protein, partial [Salmonella enterica subsp. enterica serovar Heidelberg str. N653]
TGIDIANARGDALRPGRHYASDRSGKTFSYREDMMKAVCVVRIECDALTCRRHLATQSE